MQARFAFPKFEMTDRLENIRYRQICLHDNTDMSVSKHYVVSKSSGGGKNECKPDIESTKNIRYRQICMHDNIDMSVSKNYVVSKSSGGGKIECKPDMHFESSRVLIIFKTSGTGKFACMIYIFISKKICVVFKTSGTGKFVYKTVFNSKIMSSV